MKSAVKTCKLKMNKSTSWSHSLISSLSQTKFSKSLSKLKVTWSKHRAKLSIQNQRFNLCKTKLASKNVSNSSRWHMWTTCATKLCRSTSLTTSYKVMLEATKTISIWQDLKFRINKKLYCRQKVKLTAFRSNWKMEFKTFSSWNTSWDKWMKKSVISKI